MDTNISKQLIAVIIPCYNESLTIRHVIDDFRHALPVANIYVYDNNSKDDTARIAKEAGVTVVHEYRQGKGNVLRSAFTQVEADIYLIVDGDGSHSAASAHNIIQPIIDGKADMTIGDRISNGTYALENRRSGHKFGNNLVKYCVNIIFKSNINDVMSGYRAFSRKFVKNFPIRSGGFEIETEMTVHALDKKFLIVQVPIDHTDRPEGSVSTLNTYKDGIRVLLTIFSMFKNYRPLAFFSIIATTICLLGVYFGIPVIRQFMLNGYITIPSSAVMASGLEITALLFFICGLILDTIVTADKRNYELRLIDYEIKKKEDIYQ